MEAPASPGSKPLTARELMTKLAASRQGGTAPTTALNPTHDPSKGGVSGGKPQRKRSIVLELGFNAFSSGIRAGWQTELFSRKFRAAVLAELIGMILFVAFGSAVVVNTKIGGGVDAGARDLMIPFGFGLMITVLVFAIGDISGANLNPAVTLALVVSRKMSWLRAGFYLMAQVVGAIVGSAYVYGMVGKDFFGAQGGAANGVTAFYQGWWTALGGEILGTYLLVFTVCAAADVGRDSHTKYVGAMTPLAIGFAVFLGHIILVPIDGCSINPARSLGSAVVQNKWDDHWVFWVGPICGSLAAVGTYELLFKSPAASTSSSTPTPAGTSYTGVGHGMSFSDYVDDLPGEIKRTVSDGGDSAASGDLPPPAIGGTGGTGGSARAAVVANMTSSTRLMAGRPVSSPNMAPTHVAVPALMEMASMAAPSPGRVAPIAGSDPLGANPDWR